jgi:hypothetical protein
MSDKNVQRTFPGLTEHQVWLSFNGKPQASASSLDAEFRASPIAIDRALNAHTPLTVRFAP